MKNNRMRFMSITVVILFLSSPFIHATPISSNSNIKTVEQLSIFNNLSNTLYVGGSGPDNYTTIQDAIDNANSGDIVYVYDDSSPYYENVDVSKSINLIGENRKTTIIDGGVNKIVANITANFVNFSGFTLTNNASNWLEHSGIFLRSEYNHIFNNIISLNKGSGINLFSNNNVVCGNIISNNFYGIYLYECRNNTISDNIISNNNWGIELVKSTNNIFLGNTISSSFWRAVLLHGWSHKNIFTKNIISSNNWSAISLTLCNQNIFSKNHIENNERGLELLDSHFNKIKNNNFIGNKLNPRFQSAYGNQWNGNYWGRNRNLPKFIFGSLILFEPPAHGPGFPIILPWVNIDWNPAKEPYDI